jgi:hypothetical protein
VVKRWSKGFIKKREKFQMVLTLGTLGIKYTPNYITQSQADSLLNNINSSNWTTLRNRRVQMHGVKPLKNNYAAAYPTPTWLPSLPNYYNHVLINGCSL